jgi:hypothetical protein
MEKIITGNWDGEPIWRPKTSSEKLIEALDEEMKVKVEKERDEYDDRLDEINPFMQ